MSKVLLTNRKNLKLHLWYVSHLLKLHFVKSQAHHRWVSPRF